MGNFTQKDDMAQLAAVNPQLASLIKALVAKLPFDCFVVRGLATQAEQQALYAIGRTIEKWRKPVTPLDGVTKKSQHQLGLAVDLAPIAVLQTGKWVDTYATDTLFNTMGMTAEQLATEMGITDYRWGGRFKTNPDKPHHELNRPA